MSQIPQILTEWLVVEGTGSIRLDPETGLFRCWPGVRSVRSHTHSPIDAEQSVVGELEIHSDAAGDLHLEWELTDGTTGGPLSVPIDANHLMVARFPLYGESSWSGGIKSVRVSFPEGFTEGLLGPLRLFGFSDLPPKDLQRFAQAFATIERLENRDLRLFLRYNGVYLAPLETSKWIQVSLRDPSDREILSVGRPARGNYDARWIEVNFVFPDVPKVSEADVFLFDNQTGHTIVCRAEWVES
ncbi:MAG: hypothetical protein ABIH23_25240 [bacterium]